MVDCFVLVMFLAFLMDINASACGGYVQTLPGSIQTPNYPESYPPNTECIWIIEAADDHNVHVIFITFDIVLDSSCTGDKVDFKDGPDSSSPWIASYCGNISPPNITTTGRHLYIRFVSDETVQNTGMHLRYDQVPACKIILNDSSGLMFSPNYPDNYPSLTKCVWIINAPYGSIVQLTILKLEIEYETNCFYDSLNIYDGKNESFPLHGKYCGSYTNEVLNSTSNFLFVQFKSDTSDELSGFNASYQVYRTNTIQVIDSFQNNKSDQTPQRDSVEVHETTLMNSNELTSALTTGSPDIEFLSTIYEPSLEHSTIAVSPFLPAEQESETTFDSLRSSSSQSEAIAEDVETYDPWTIEIMPSSNYYTSDKNSALTIAEQSGFETPMTMVQIQYQTYIADSTDGDGASSHSATIIPNNQPSMDTNSEHDETPDRWTIDIMPSENSVSTIAEQSGWETPMTMMQSNYETAITAPRSEDRVSSHDATIIPKNQPIIDSHEIFMSTKTEQIQPTLVLESTNFILSQDEMSTEAIHHTAVENKTSPGITTIVLPTIITLVTSGIIIGVVCAIKLHVKKIANLKVAPVDHPL